MYNRKQTNLVLFPEHLIIDKPKIGQIVMCREYVYPRRGLRGGFDRYVAKMVMTESDIKKAYSTWNRRNCNDRLPLTTLASVNSLIWHHNYAIENNREPYEKPPTFLKRATKKNTDIGDVLVKVFKVRTRFKTKDVAYDGTFDLKGYFIK